MTPSVRRPIIPPAVVAKQTEAALTAIRKKDGPILVGPWVGEVGFELLYWIPFLMWAQRFAGLDPDRLLVLSRGGCASWYAHLTSHYRDLTEDWSVSEIRANHGRGPSPVKQRQLSAFDRAAIDKVRQAIGVKGSVLHPSLMYSLCLPFWHNQANLSWLSARRRMALMAPAADDLALDLPESFVAVKFYKSAALPDSADTRRFVSDTVTMLASHTDVVLLQSGVAMDEHIDFPIALQPRVHVITPKTPATNLQIQTAIVRRASALVGTYGGFSYLAPLLGVPTVSLYSHEGRFRADHLTVAEQDLGALSGAGVFRAVDLREGIGVFSAGFQTSIAAIGRHYPLPAKPFHGWHGPLVPAVKLPKRIARRA